MDYQFAWPLRPWRDVKVDATFLDASYFKSLGRWHKGIDLNLKTGGDTDLGYPVQSIFPGRVVFAQNDVSSWGGIVLVRSDMWVVQLVANLLGVNLSVLDVQYAHLHHCTVREGDEINAGDHVGSIGKGTNNTWLAHLHLEMRRVVRSAAEGQGGSDKAKLDAMNAYLDPLEVMGVLNMGDYSNLLRKGTSVLPGRGADEIGLLPQQHAVVTVNDNLHVTLEHLTPHDQT
jgi:murein DD-endopeptidase MepM/ murein hydrolase activator NlpD